MALAATDTGSGVSVIRYTTDGTTPTTSSPPYTGPFKLTATTTVAFRAWDVVGNAEPVRTQSIAIDPAPPLDSTPPVTTISCGGVACTSGPYALGVSVSLSATDTGGSGVDETYYTLDGTTPTTGSTPYGGPFVVDRSTVVRFFSTDRTGNAEQPRSATVYVNGAPTHVALTWDDGTISQYELAFERALLPHGVDGTYYVNSGTLGTGDHYMTWADVGAIEASGSEIGGHTVDHVIVKGLDAASAFHQICDDRTALADHGLHPTSFAYPEGAFDSASESVARSCGYANARSAGSITLGGPIYAETIPPKDDYAIRAWSTPSGPEMIPRRPPDVGVERLIARRRSRPDRRSLRLLRDVRPRQLRQLPEECRLRRARHAQRVPRLDAAGRTAGWSTGARDRGQHPRWTAIARDTPCEISPLPLRVERYPPNWRSPQCAKP